MSNNEFDMNKMAENIDIKNLLNDTMFINLMKEESCKIFNSKKVNGYDFDDLFQDLFLNKYNSLLKYDKNKSKFSSYLYRVISFRIIEVFRTNKSYSEKVKNYRMIKDVSIFPNFNENLLEVIKKKLYHFEYKIFLEQYSGYSSKEIAKINKTDVGFIERRLHNVRDKLRKDSDIQDYYKDVCKKIN